MKLVVGLGNPGEQYKNTPHNAGWLVVDKLAERYGASWHPTLRFQAMTCSISVNSRNVTLMKPLTYMNLSGQSISLFAQKNGLHPNELLVISDELAFPIGTARLRESGSPNGHNGLLSISQVLGTKSFPRIRVGIAPDSPVSGDYRAQYVLKKLPPKMWEEFMVGVEIATDAAEFALKNSFTAAMNRFHIKEKKTPSSQDKD